jgi:hypothetical protein
MTWLLLIVNVASLILALRKRVLPYFLFTLYFLFLVVGQAFQISSDMEGRNDITYLYAFMSRSGFNQAMLFALASSALSLAIVLNVRGYKRGTVLPVLRSFQPPPFFYPLLFLFLFVTAGILIFVVVGVSKVLTSSRPGLQSGSTIFLTLLAFGIYPLFLKILYRTRIQFGDIFCAGFALIVTVAFSRMHIIFYTTSLLTAIYYSRGWADRRIRVKAVIGFGLLAVLGASAFLFIGALRQAQNFTNGSIVELIQYNREHPETDLLAIGVTYQRSVEGMSGLAGAFTAAAAKPLSVRHDYGLAWVIEGGLQWLPGMLKARVKGLENDLLYFDWYHRSIVASGIQTSYTSFGWFGVVFYPLAFFGFAWLFCLFVVRHPLSPPFKLCGYLLIGCGVYFVRGTLTVWIGVSIAYIITILGSAPLWSMWVIPGRPPSSQEAETAAPTLSKIP